MKSNKLKKNKITLDKYINLAMYSKKNGYYEKGKFLEKKEILLPLLIYQVFLEK